MKNQILDGKNLLIDLLGSVCVETNELVNSGKKTQAAKLAEAFQCLPALIAGTLQMTPEEYCDQFVSKYDSEYDTYYVNKIISSAYNSLDNLKNLNDFLENRERFCCAANSVITFKSHLIFFSLENLFVITTNHFANK